MLGLVAHVRAIDAVEFLERAGNIDDFLRWAPRCDEFVVKARGKADRAGGKRFAHRLAHAPDLGGGGGAIEVVHRDHAQRHVADQQRTVDRGRMRAEFLDIGAEGRKAEPAAFVVEQVERRGHRRPSCRPARGERDAAVARHHRRDALAHFRRHVAGGQHQAVVVRVRVDETRRRDFPAGIDFDIGRAPRRGGRCARPGPPRTPMSPSKRGAPLPSMIVAFRISKSK